MKSIATTLCALSLLLLPSCGDSNTSEEEGNNDKSYFIAFNAGGEAFKESGANTNYSSQKRASSFGILNGEINISFKHEGIEPTALIGESVELEVYHNAYRTGNMENTCSCLVESAVQSGKPNKMFGQPYRVKGAFDGCVYAKEGRKDQKEITDGKLDILVYYLKE